MFMTTTPPPPGLRRTTHLPHHHQHPPHPRIMPLHHTINDSNWRKISAEDDRCTLYNKRLIELTSRNSNMTYDTLCKTVVRAGRKTAVSTRANAKDGANLAKTPSAQSAPPKNRSQNRNQRTRTEPQRTTEPPFLPPPTTPSHCQNISILPGPRPSPHTVTIVTYEAFHEITNFIHNNGEA